MNYEQFAPDFAPQSGPNYPDLSRLPDGDYEFTILTATEKETKSGHTLIELECRCEQTQVVVPKTYFTSGDKGQEQVNRFAGDMGTLGFPVGDWSKKVKLTDGIKDAIGKLKGKRFKGTKKTNSGKDGKVYHNLYINAALPDAGPETLQEAMARTGPADPDVPF